MAQEPLEAMLLRLAPRADQDWQGASADEIQMIQQFAGQELPAFYRWLLGRVGRNAGSLPEFYRAFYARKAIEAYESDDVDTEPPILFIARLEDAVFPLDLYYDLSQPARDDAWVDGYQTDGGLTYSAETLRELLGWMSIQALKIVRSPQQCSGTFVDRDGDLTEDLTRVITSLGFTEPLPTGSFCKIFERDDIALVCKLGAQTQKAYLRAFSLGGPDAGVLRRVLGEVTVRTQIEIQISEWTPSVEVP
jgi:hypothetical protein